MSWETVKPYLPLVGLGLFAIAAALAMRAHWLKVREALELEVRDEFISGAAAHAAAADVELARRRDPDPVPG